MSPATLDEASVSASARSRSSSVRLYFDECEFRVDSGELVRGDDLVRVPPQPSKVLALLARRSGQVVSRDELCEEIWGDGTCVDFEEGLNYCIKQLRRALDDDASSPRYIETVHRRGYRFMAPVTIGEATPEVASVAGARHATVRGPAAPRLVVLELVEIGPELPYSRFGVTLTEELLVGLSERLEQRFVVVSGTLERLRRGAGEPGPGDVLLEGSVRAEGDSVVVSLRVSHLEQGRPLWSRRFEFPWRGEASLCSDRPIVEHLIDSLVADAVPSAGTGGPAS
ncbi:MAG TPA: winged helix-turn-helix domain-containing protein [Thermoanaerobaculia bacterium]|nr:winged helix-turn-helix domain-containing protein [Thermoanaerobaculia bacterium]